MFGERISRSKVNCACLFGVVQAEREPVFVLGKPCLLTFLPVGEKKTTGMDAGDSKERG
jgi:hypothetical protein